MAMLFLSNEKCPLLQIFGSGCTKLYHILFSESNKRIRTLSGHHTNRPFLFSHITHTHGHSTINHTNTNKQINTHFQTRF